VYFLITSIINLSFLFYLLERKASISFGSWVVFFIPISSSVKPIAPGSLVLPIAVAALLAPYLTEISYGKLT
jgi:hypothetical protein